MRSGIISTSLRRACAVLGMTSHLAIFLIAAPSLAFAATASSSQKNNAFDCVIEPQQLVKLASPVVGVIARLDVDRGDIVKKGQVLGKLEDDLEEAHVALARAKATNDYAIKAGQAHLQFLKTQHGRATQLLKKEFASQATADEAEADAKVAEQQLKEAELNFQIAQLEVKQAEVLLSQRTLRSPFDGIVVERLLLPGEYRNDQSPILTLAQIDPLRVEVFVPTASYGRIKTGDKAKVHPESPIAGEFEATVVVVDHVLDAASGTFGVRLELPNPGLRLPGGLKCGIEFDLSEH